MSTIVGTQASMNDAAVEFFRQVGESSVAATSVTYKTVELIAKYDPIEEADQLNAALQGLLLTCGYETDYKTLQDVFSQAMISELGCWSGNYALFDEEGTTYSMVLGRDGAQVMTPLATTEARTMTEEEAHAAVKQMTLESTAFKDGTLTLSNDRYAFSLQFPVPDVDEVPSLSSDSRIGGQPRCEGMVTITADGKTKTLSVKGKRGSYTRAGIEQAADGDPASTWAGVYKLYETTGGKAIKEIADRVVIRVGADGMELSWGSDISGDHYQYHGNAVLCTDADDDTTLYAMQFSFNKDGIRQLALAKVISGEISSDAERTYVGHWVGDGAQKSVTPAPNFKAAAHKAMAVGSSVITGAPATPDDPSYLTTFNIDMTQLSTTSGAGKQTPIPMPIGVYGNMNGSNAYVVTLSLSNKNAELNYTWATAPSSSTGDSTPRIHLQTVASDTTGATVTFMFSGFTAADLTAGTLSGYVNVTDNATTPNTYYMQMQIPVMNASPIVISPTSVPSPIQGLDYTQEFTADGGQAQEYVWFDNGSMLPGGMTFDLSTQKLKGKASGDIGVTYMLYVAAYAPQGWVMNCDSIDVALPLTSQASIIEAQVDYAAIAWQTAAGLLGTFLLCGSIYKGVWNWRDRQDAAKVKDFTKKLETTYKNAIIKASGNSKTVTSIVASALAADDKYMSEYGSFKNKYDSEVMRLSFLVEIMQCNDTDFSKRKKKLLEITKKTHVATEIYNDDPKSEFYGWNYGDLFALKTAVNNIPGDGSRGNKDTVTKYLKDTSKLFRHSSDTRYAKARSNEADRAALPFHERFGLNIKDFFAGK